MYVYVVHWLVISLSLVVMKPTSWSYRSSVVTDTNDRVLHSLFMALPQLSLQWITVKPNRVRIREREGGSERERGESEA